MELCQGIVELGIGLMLLVLVELCIGAAELNIGLVVLAPVELRLGIAELGIVVEIIAAPPAPSRPLRWLAPEGIRTDGKDPTKHTIIKNDDGTPTFTVVATRT